MGTEDPGERENLGSPQEHPQQAVDAIEERIFGAPDDAAHDQAPTPAIEQNLDNDDLGTAAAGDEPSG